ncbi:hypothetical protein [Streptomyces sp. C10-9-1]|uniref:hypothetical protein n=1 Tax=Streptomyces sp. C10-9-1 TaxID=1859285 RepID=UPI003D72B35E
MWNSLAVRVDGRVVGQVTGARDEDGPYGIGGLPIDGAEQGRGAGRAAATALSGRLAARGTAASCACPTRRGTPRPVGRTPRWARVTGDTEGEGEEMVAELAAERVPPPSSVALPRC